MEMAVGDNDELYDHPDLRDDPPSRSSPVQQLPSPSPPPMRERAMAQRPDIVGNMAGKHPVKKIAEFDQHYMPDGQPNP